MSTIAAIIPLYNGAAYIEAAVRSVLDQERPADEIIVVDDGSTDNGASLVTAMAAEHPMIRLLHKENGGQGSARNYGVAHCNSDLIALLDQDDYWYSNHLKELEQAFVDAQNPRLAYVYSNLDRIDDEGGMVLRGCLDYFKIEEQPKRTLVGCLKANMYILPSASLILKSAFQSVHGFDERLRGYEDDDLFLKLFCADFQGAYVNKSLSAWRIHSASTSASIRMLISAQIYYDTLVETFKNKNKASENLVADIIAPRFALIGHRTFKTYIKHDDRSDDAKLALGFASKCMRSMRLAGRTKMQIRISKYVALFYLRQLFRKRDIGHS
jgi:glycosyltransferase involved in cell wall biosynthesis